MLTRKEQIELRELEIVFRRNGGRGVETADRIDELRAKRDSKPRAKKPVRTRSNN